MSLDLFGFNAEQEGGVDSISLFDNDGHIAPPPPQSPVPLLEALNDFLESLILKCENLRFRLKDSLTFYSALWNLLATGCPVIVSGAK